MNTVHAFISGDDQNFARNEWLPAPQEETPTLSPEINRMLSAAVVSAPFRRLLLRDPVVALSYGYNGESFEIKADELAQIVLIKAESIAEFASQLIDRLWYGNGASPESSRQPVGEMNGPTQRLGMEPIFVTTSATDAQEGGVGHRR